MINSYIHYGNSYFSKDQFVPIKNKEYLTKPYGGLWASPIHSDLPWKKWCKENEFIPNWQPGDERKTYFDKWFTFKVSYDANILYIRNTLDIKKDYILKKDLGSIRLDFEKIMSVGYDAIDVTMNYYTYYALYGWDCDTLLIMNPEIVKVTGYSY